MNVEDYRLLAEQLRTYGVRLSGPELTALLRGMAAAPASDGEAFSLVLGADLDGTAREALANALAWERDRYRDLLRPYDPARLERLRAELRRQSLDGFIVPRADEHQGEYVPLRAERLAWITGFTGSAGMAVVFADKAALFVDGRYTLQARSQVDGSLFEFRHLVDEPPSDWIAKNVKAQDRLGYDPWHLPPSLVERLETAAAKSGGSLVAVSDNPIDAVWADQPPPPLAPIVPHGERHAGRSSTQKRQEVAAALTAERLDAVFVAAPESVAWLFNLRGGDIPFAPLPLGFVIARGDGTADLFVDGRKLTREARDSLGNGVRVHAPDAMAGVLGELGAAGLRVGVDREAAPQWVVETLRSRGAHVIWFSDPCALPKARKNPVEQDGIRNAHRRDGLAVCRFLAWLKEATEGRGVKESEAAARLDAFRREDPTYRGPSFATISGAGPNGAIVHYRLSPETDRVLDSDGLFLIDSGGQYPDGTTDITRTVAVGTPSEEMRTRFTLVLKGHIALATARFPKGTTGSQLDVLARRPLWDAGLDYDHGTGHGVGCYLSVHEGPARISKLPNRVPLEPGMLLSIEPGFYKTGAYGIRIENLAFVQAADAAPFLEFETVTLAPIDRTLVVPSLMSDAEKAWLDGYHARVRETLAPMLDEATRSWLERATKPF